MSLLEDIAPSIAAALGGPLAGVAVSVLTNFVAIDEDGIHAKLEIPHDIEQDVKDAENEFNKNS